MRKRAAKNKTVERPKGSPLESVPTLTRNFIEFTDFVMSNFGDPANWPLSDNGRIHFARQVFWRARRIAESKDYAELKLRVATARLANSVLKGAEKV